MFEFTCPLFSEHRHPTWGQGSEEIHRALSFGVSALRRADVPDHRRIKLIPQIRGVAVATHQLQNALERSSATP